MSAREAAELRRQLEVTQITLRASERDRIALQSWASEVRVVLQQLVTAGISPALVSHARALLGARP